MREVLAEVAVREEAEVQMIAEYKIVTADTFEELEQAVNQRLREGWQLWGYMTSTNDDVGDYLAQVMVKPDIEQ